MKEQYENRGIGNRAWFTFYHDADFPACKFDEKGNIVDSVPQIMIP
jgi:hypothetical protein